MYPIFRRIFNFEHSFRPSLKGHELWPRSCPRISKVVDLHGRNSSQAHIPSYTSTNFQWKDQRVRCLGVGGWRSSHCCEAFKIQSFHLLHAWNLLKVENRQKRPQMSIDSSVLPVVIVDHKLVGHLGFPYHRMSNHPMPHMAVYHSFKNQMSYPVQKPRVRHFVDFPPQRFTIHEVHTQVAWVL